MSFVGPRPALFNQYDLIALRTQCGVDALVPGLTGWAQVNGRDALSIPDKVLTPIGSFLRRSSLDELPQLWSILKGDMSFVGPRPALFNQYDLIELRSECGVDALVPGLTGWAQVNGRDALSIEDKVQFDLQYLQRRSFLMDMKILYITFVKVMRRAEVSH